MLTLLQRGDVHLFTPAHAEFAMLSLKSHAYRQALAVLDKPVYKVDPVSTGSEALDFIRYCYYRGCIYLNLKMVNKAIDSFLTGFMCPSQVVLLLLLLLLLF